jgi:ATP-binding cassette subfamily B (MDR/TAP) protein 8
VIDMACSKLLVARHGWHRGAYTASPSVYNASKQCAAIVVRSSVAVKAFDFSSQSFGGIHKLLLAVAAAVPSALLEDSNTIKHDSPTSAVHHEKVVSVATPLRAPTNGWSLWQWLKYLWAVSSKDVVLIIVAGGLSIACVALGLMIPSIMGSFWDAFKSADATWLAAAQLGAVLVAKFLLQTIASSLLAFSTEAMASAMRQDLFARLLEFDMGFFDSTEIADLVSILTGDIKEIRDALRAVVGEGVPAVAHCIGAVASLLATSAKLTAGLVGVLPPMIAIGNLYAGRLRKLSRKNQTLQAKTGAIASESLSNIRTVRAFTGEAEEAHRYQAAQAASSSSSVWLGAEISLFKAVVGFGLSAFAGGVLWWGSTLVQRGEMTNTGLAAFLGQAMSLERALEGISEISSKVVKAQGTAQRVSGTLDIVPCVNRRGGRTWPNVHGDINVDSVTFAYPGRPRVPVLRDVSLQLPAGKVVALCGASGSGKSTIASLLLGFYRPQRGGVSLDGENLSDVDLHWYRSKTAYVSQEAPMFNTTIRGNILYGKHEATDEELRRACDAAHIGEFVQHLPLGLDTPVGERGVSLSGGASMRRPDIRSAMF